MTRKTFNKILIANRGEIACRVIRTARKMGVRTVAVYSDADRNALHVTMADEAIHIGASASKDSYLNFDRVIDAAKFTGAEAIHPGYGFLSENADFCRACAENNIVFIGPTIPAIEAMGSKSAAKSIMEKAKVPLVPGYHGEDQSADGLKQASNEMGYPVLLKAVAGGGGKGMRQVWRAEEFDEALVAAKREAMNGFGNDDMLVEKYLIEPRHVEIQIFCDQQGNAVYLFERDCSVQRRHQKVIEEAPAPGMTKVLREAMGETAIRAAQAINYEGAGTVEFLLDKEGVFFFMEMNTRLQVEHPVTEMITGQDLVEWQLRVAAGEDLPVKQSQLEINGHAFEARIYAEDPSNDFLPATGTLEYFQIPEASTHVRVDTGVRQGDDISIYYDPMIAKLIVWDENRSKALQRLSRALQEFKICGTTTNIDFLHRLTTCESFQKADLDTGFIEKNRAVIFRDDELEIVEDLALVALFLVLNRARKVSQKEHAYLDPFSFVNTWRMNEACRHRFTVNLHDQIYELYVEEYAQSALTKYIITIDGDNIEAQGHISNSILHADIGGHRTHVAFAEHRNGVSLFTQDNVINFQLVDPDTDNLDENSSTNSLIAPMNGTVVALMVQPGEKVSMDDPLLILEAMKMEHTIRAPKDGIVHELYFSQGDLVDGGAELVHFEAVD